MRDQIVTRELVRHSRCPKVPAHDISCYASYPKNSTRPRISRAKNIRRSEHELLVEFSVPILAVCVVVNEAHPLSGYHYPRHTCLGECEEHDQGYIKKGTSRPSHDGTAVAVAVFSNRIWWPSCRSPELPSVADTDRFSGRVNIYTSR